MKRYFLVVLCLLLLTIPLHADVDTKDGSAVTTTSNMDGSGDSHDVADGQDLTAAAGGPDAWYYPSAETDSGYTTGNSYIGDAALLRSYITATTGGSLTKVAYKLATYHAEVTAVICQVYDSSKNLIAGANGSVAQTDDVGTWFEMTLATPYTIGDAESVYVALGATGNGGSKVGSAATGNDDHYNCAWGSPPTFPDPIADGSINWAELGIKIYVD